MSLNNQNYSHTDDHDQLFITRIKRAKRESREQLLIKLDRAVMLGNMHGEATLFHYTDGYGIPQMKEDVVQAVTARHVIFRGGNMLLMDRITQVDI